DRGMLDLRAVLTLNNRPFTLGCFGLVFEHREEPRRATLVRGGIYVPNLRHPSTVGVSVGVLVCIQSPAFQPPALFVHFFSCMLIQQHIRRKTTSTRTAVNVVTLAHPPTIAVCSGVTYPLGIVIRLHPACVDV